LTTKERVKLTKLSFTDSCTLTQKKQHKKTAQKKQHREKRVFPMLFFVLQNETP
jgi:hypothetical protein